MDNDELTYFYRNIRNYHAVLTAKYPAGEIDYTRYSRLILTLTTWEYVADMKRGDGD